MPKAMFMAADKTELVHLKDAKPIWRYAEEAKADYTNKRHKDQNLYLSTKFVFSLEKWNEKRIFA